jgi:replicative DNA helicase
MAVDRHSPHSLALPGYDGNGRGLALDRQPPHNIEAEQSTLGSLIIDPEAYIRVAEFLKADDFYREAHRSIYAAIADLNERHEPADLITLCDELERRGVLAEVGGPSYVTTLVNLVPTSTHVEHYGHIIERTATMRRLIAAAGQIATLGYEDNEDTEATLDRAEQILFAISQRRLAGDFLPLRTLLHDYLDRIDYVHQHRGEVAGVPTGFADLDRLTGGLQPSDLIIIGARPSMGKTALCVSLAHASAMKHGTVVGMFALEMSAEQIVQRFMSIEAAVDQQRLRTGYIDDQEWDRIIAAAGALSEAPIYVDDTPGITTMEVRAKARRLAAQVPLGLIIIDYLQLMQGRGRGDGNRVQEISEISRSLKGLARELDVPVIALAQLSRGVESRQDHHPMLSDLRESGCLPGDSLVFLPDTGTYQRIDKLVGSSGFNVLALNTESWRFEKRPVLRAFSTGRKPVFRLQTRLGRSIRATANHQFLVASGWRRLDRLALGAPIAVGELTESRSDVPTAHPPRHDVVGEIAESRVMAKDQEMNLLAKTTKPLRGYPHQQHRPNGSTLAAPEGLGYPPQWVAFSRGIHPPEAPAAGDFANVARPFIVGWCWDEITSIEAAGEEEVYDLTVDGLHNFVADNVVVHNSIEQDADIVMFIYRDEVYNPSTDRHGIADIIVAKHRNGPVGQVSLRWLEQTARFVDLELYHQPTND